MCKYIIIYIYIYTIYYIYNIHLIHIHLIPSPPRPCRLHVAVPTASATKGCGMMALKRLGSRPGWWENDSSFIGHPLRSSNLTRTIGVPKFSARQTHGFSPVSPRICCQDAGGWRYVPQVGRFAWRTFLNSQDRASQSCKV